MGKKDIIDGNGRKLYPVNGKPYIVDGDGRKLYPTNVDKLVDGDVEVDLKDYAKKSDLKAYAKKSDIPDLSEYAKKSEVKGEVDDAVDQAIQDLDIEKYIDEDELAQKIGELALEDYAKKADLEALESDYNEFKQGISEGMTVVAESLDNHARDISALQEAVSRDIPATYATKTDLSDKADSSRFDEFEPNDGGAEGTLERWAGGINWEIDNIQGNYAEKSYVDEEISGLDESLVNLQDRVSDDENHYVKWLDKEGMSINDAGKVLVVNAIQPAGQPLQITAEPIDLGGLPVGETDNDILL